MTTHPTSDSAPPTVRKAAPLPLLAVRSVIGGALMGLANLVPGISGGTMLLASGVYPRFIAAIAELSTFKFRFRSILTLGLVVLAALMAIGLLAGAVKTLVVDHRWIMYSIFIGLTLGGVPVVWKLIRQSSHATRLENADLSGDSRAATAAPGLGRASGPAIDGEQTSPRPEPLAVELKPVVPAAVVGFLGMAVLAWFQSQGAGAGGANTGFAFMLLAGVVAASAMILPGVSGGYLFLVLGVYLPVLAGIDAVKDALGARDFAAAVDPGLTVILPIGIGVAVGVVGVSNALKWLLKHHEKATLGFLLGLLIGAVVGLWPFQQGVPPEVGQMHQGEILTMETVGRVPPEDYPTRFFTPSFVQVAGSLALILAGFTVTALIARLGGDGEP